LAWTCSDKKIDEEMSKLLKIIREEWGITNCSRTDVLRFLLQMKKQGKKTSPRWKRLFEGEEENANIFRSHHKL